MKLPWTRFVIFTVGCAVAGSAAPASPPAPALPRYTMDVTLVPATHELRVTGTVVVPSPGKAITVALADTMTEVELTSTPAGTWSVASAAPPPGTSNVEHTLTLAAPAREVAIRFSYASHVAARFVYHVAEDAMFAGGPNLAWYPQLTPRQATGTLRYHVPARYRVVAGGAPSDRVTGDTRSTTIAYATPSTFSFIAAAFIERTRDGVVPMRAYVLGDRPGIDTYLAGCSRVLEILTREFGAYPYAGFALVEVPSAAAKAAGFSGASFEGFMAASADQLDAPFNLAYFGHEIGHQWWGNLVTREGRDGGDLTDEGLAQYGSLRAVEEIEGEAAAETYRRRGYPGYNDDQCGFGYLRNAAAGIDEPVAAAHDGYSPITHMLANSKGLLALDHLSRVVGRDVFRAALHHVTRRYAFRAMPWRALRALVEARAGRDLSATFAQWFDRTGAPAWSVEWTPSGRTARGVIVQHGAPYQLDVEVALVGAHDTATRRLALAGARTAFAFDAPFDVVRIELDPHFTILHWTPAYRAEAEAYVDYTRASARSLAGDSAGAAAAFAAGIERVPAGERYGVRFMLEYGYGRLLQGDGDLAQAKRHLAAAVAAPVRSPERLPWAYVRLAQIAAEEHDRDAVVRYARAAVDAERAAGHSVGAATAVAPLVANAAP